MVGRGERGQHFPFYYFHLIVYFLFRLYKTTMLNVIEIPGTFKKFNVLNVRWNTNEVLLLNIYLYVLFSFLKILNYSYVKEYSCANYSIIE